MKNVKALTLGAAIASALVSGTAMADLSGNIGIGSNYLWRGVTQNADEAAISGGIDYSHASGAYVGTWVSNLNDGAYEHDVYFGYGADAGDISYDVGYIAYLYPLDTSATGADFSEVYVGLGYGNFGLNVALTVDTDWGGDDSDMYVSATGEFEVKEGLALGVLVGNYNFDDAASEDYTHWQLSLSKDDFTFALDKNDQTPSVGGTEDDMRVTVSWSKEFTL